MIRKTLIVALTCAGLAFGAVAEAKDRGRGHGHGPGHGHSHFDKHGPRAHHKHKGHHHGYGRAPKIIHHHVWTPPPRHWSRGDRLPHFHRGGYHVIHDWHAHRLYRPHPGHRWVRVGSEYLLVAVASGIITAIILNQ